MHRLSGALLHVSRIVFWGKRLTDPIDGRSYRKFFKYGYAERSTRKDALSPGTLSLERHRLMWLWLKRETTFFSEPARMLHVAPEYCFMKRFKAQPNLDVITADLESPWADVKMDLHAIPFPENSFDVVFCNHVLEHVTDDQQCMREMVRVLKPGGWALIQSPMNIHAEKTVEDPSITDPGERERLFGQYDHVRMYGRDFQARLEKAGFLVERIDYLKKLTAEEISRYSVRGPSGDDHFYRCIKP
jgi:SAM-dependent methyltransferase